MPGSWFSRRSITTKLTAIVMSFVAMIVIILVVEIITSGMSTGVRAHVRSEGMWSKGHKDAVYNLTLYAYSRNEQHYHAYRQAIAIPLGSRAARDEMEKPSYDYNIVERGFVQGGSDPADVPYMIFLFRRFQDVHNVVEALRVWKQTDPAIDALVQCAEEMHAAVRGGTLTPELADELLGRIEALNAKLTPLEQEFSAILGEGSRSIRRVALTTLFTVTGFLLAGGLWLSWRIARDLRAGIQGLCEGAQRVAEGNLYHPIAVQSGDEIGELAVAFNRMIEQRRNVEAAYKATTALLSSVIRTANDAFVAIDARGRVSEWNQQAETTFGWTRAEALDQSLSDLIIPPRHRQDHEAGLSRFLQTGLGTVLNRRIEITALDRVGNEFPVELTLWATSTAGGYRFNAFLHDISERRRVVQRLDAQKAAATALVESATLPEAATGVLQAVCGNLEWEVGALWLPDASGKALHCTAFWHREGLSIPGFEEISRRSSFVSGVGLPGRVWSSGQAAWIFDVRVDANFPRAEYARRAGLHGALGFPIYSGSQILGVAEFFSSTSQNPDPELLRMMENVGNLLGQYIGRKRAEAELRARVEELARSNEELERFAYVASHDLQEPLRTISSYTQLLVRQLTPAQRTESADFVGFITNAATRMRALIEGLLSYSRVSRQPTALKPADLNRVLDQALVNLKGGLDSSAALITRDALPEVLADGAQICQVLQNLISNALKFRGQEPPRLHIGAARDGAQWRISVRDHGIGIDPQYAERIFLLFQRLHSSDHYPGSGLGLAICQKIVERHGGRIWVESANPGCVFYFTLPAAGSPEAESAA